MNPAMREHAASDDHIVKCTKVGQHLAIFIHLANGDVGYSTMCLRERIEIIVFKMRNHVSVMGWFER